MEHVSSSDAIVLSDIMETFLCALEKGLLPVMFKTTSSLSSGGDCQTVTEFCLAVIFGSANTWLRLSRCNAKPASCWGSSMRVSADLALLRAGEMASVSKDKKVFL